MKKIIALVLALVMVLSLSTVALAKHNPKIDLPEIVGNTVAASLQYPALLLSNALEAGHENIVQGVLKTAPVVYKNLHNTVITLNAAMKMSAKSLEATVAAVGGSVYLASELTEEVLKAVDQNDLASQTDLLGKAALGAVKAAYNEVEEFVGKVDKIVNVIFTTQFGIKKVTVTIPEEQQFPIFGFKGTLEQWLGDGKKEQGLAQLVDQALTIAEKALVVPEYFAAANENLDGGEIAEYIAGVIENNGKLNPRDWRY